MVARILLIAAFFSVILVPHLAPAQEPDARQKAELLDAKRKLLASVRPGTFPESVLTLLGPPDEIRHVADAPWHRFLEERGGRFETECWAYGISAPGAFARIGIISIDQKGFVLQSQSPDYAAASGRQGPQCVAATSNDAVETRTKMRCQLEPKGDKPHTAVALEKLNWKVSLINSGTEPFEFKGDGALDLRVYLLTEVRDSRGTLLIREDHLLYHSPYSFRPENWPVLTVPPAQEKSAELSVGFVRQFGPLPAGKYSLRVFFPFEHEKWIYYPSNLVEFEIAQQK